MIAMNSPNINISTDSTGAIRIEYDGKVYFRRSFKGAIELLDSFFLETKIGHFEMIPPMDWANHMVASRVI